MGVADANVAFAAETADLIRVIWDDVHFLDQLDVGSPARQIEVNIRKSGTEELIGCLP